MRAWDAQDRMEGQEDESPRGSAPQGDCQHRLHGPSLPLADFSFPVKKPKFENPANTQET